MNRTFVWFPRNTLIFKFSFSKKAYFYCLCFVTDLRKSDKSLTIDFVGTVQVKDKDDLLQCRSIPWGPL